MATDIPHLVAAICPDVFCEPKLRGKIKAMLNQAIGLKDPLAYLNAAKVAEPIEPNAVAIDELDVPRFRRDLERALGLEGQLGCREEAGQGHQDVVLAELEAGPQHPLELQHDGHGHEQRRALGDVTELDEATLRDMGMMLGEIWDMEALGEDCAKDGVYVFLLVAQQLRVTGGVGSPVNPIAIK